MDFQRAEYKGIILSTLAVTKELGVYNETDVARAFSGDGDLYWYKRDWLEFYFPEKLSERDKDWKEEGINWEPDAADIFDENEYPLISRKAALKYLGVNTPLAVITRETLSLIRRGLFHGSIKEEYALAMDLYRIISALYADSEEHLINGVNSGKAVSEYSDFSPESAKADAARLAPFTLFDIAVGRNDLLNWLIPLPTKLCDAGMAKEGVELAASWAELAEPDIFIGDKAFLLVEAGFGDEARAQIKHNLKIFEENAGIHIKAGVALEILNDLSAAEVLYRKALELAEDEEESDDAFEYLIPLLRQLGKTTEADALEAAQEREHRKPPSWPATVKRDALRMGRNEPCPCGSGKKYKKCRLNKEEKENLNIPGQYLSRSNEIIGERTSDEKKYDTEVIRWLNKGKSIQKAIAKANEKFPAEALSLNAGNLAGIQAHYDYLAKHESIMRKPNN